MDLFIVRHGIAVDRFDPTVNSDEERWLTDLGQRKTRRVAEALRRMRAEVDLVLTSPLVRARETALIMHEVLEVKAPLVETAALEPGFTLNELLTACAPHAGVGGLMLVGHEPDLSALVSTLVCGDDRGDFVFKKAGVALLDVDHLSEDEYSASLRWFLPPKILCAISR